MLPRLQGLALLGRHYVGRNFSGTRRLLNEYERHGVVNRFSFGGPHNAPRGQRQYSTALGHQRRPFTQLPALYHPKRALSGGWQRVGEHRYAWIIDGRTYDFFLGKIGPLESNTVPSEAFCCGEFGCIGRCSPNCECKGCAFRRGVF